MVSVSVHHDKRSPIPKKWGSTMPRGGTATNPNRFTPTEVTNEG
jgi:hypothetical protein